MGERAVPFFFCFFCFLSCIGHHSAGSQTPGVSFQPPISTSVDCGLHGLPNIPTDRHRDTDGRTGHSGSDAVELTVSHIIVPWRLNSSAISIHWPLHITGKLQKSSENVDCWKNSGLSGELLQVIMAWPQFAAGGAAALSISTSTSTTTTTTTGVPFAPHSLYK